jgi:hypothetical protein
MFLGVGAMPLRTAIRLVAAAGLTALALGASAQVRTNMLAVAPPRPGASQPLPIDMATAQRQARSDFTQRGRVVNGKFISANAAAINQITIPVLLPIEPDLAPGLRIFPNGPFYTVSSKSNGMSFVLTGSGRAFPVNSKSAHPLVIPPDGIVIDGAEGGMNASFNRFGASYSISLECASPTSDPRCTNPAYVRGVIARLMVVIPGTVQ